MNLPFDVTRQTLESTPARVLAFLHGAGTWRSIRHALQTHGYTNAEHDLGWKLLRRCLNRPSALAVEADAQVREAVAELDATDEPLFRATAATLDRLHPEQGDFVFADLEPATGPASVVAMATFLDRLDALEASPDREATRAADRAALATLAARGLGPDERARLRTLVEVAMNVDPTEPGAPPLGGDDARVEDLVALRKWHLDWAATARTVLKRRDELVRLGLAQRRRRAAKGEDATEPMTPVAPAPADRGGAGPTP